jgi:hypothetical protein
MKRSPHPILLFKLQFHGFRLPNRRSLARLAQVSGARFCASPCLDMELRTNWYLGLVICSSTATALLHFPLCEL